MQVVQCGGWTDDTYLHVLPPGRVGAKASVTGKVVQELDEVTYNVEVTTNTFR